MEVTVKCATSPEACRVWAWSSCQRPIAPLHQQHFPFILTLALKRSHTFTRPSPVSQSDMFSFFFWKPKRCTSNYKNSVQMIFNLGGLYSGIWYYDGYNGNSSNLCKLMWLQNIKDPLWIQLYEVQCWEWGVGMSEFNLGVLSHELYYAMEIKPTN